MAGTLYTHIRGALTHVVRSIRDRRTYCGRKITTALSIVPGPPGRTCSRCMEGAQRARERRRAKRGRDLVRKHTA